MKATVIGANSILSQRLLKNLDETNKFSKIIGVYHKNTNNCNVNNVEYLSINDYLKKNSQTDYLFLVAAHIPYSNWNSYSKQLIDTNVILLKKIIDNKNFNRIIFCSSVSVLGVCDKLEKNEESPYHLTTPYSETKFFGEVLVKQCESYSIVRISSIVGKGISTSTFIPRMIEQANKTKEIVLYGDGKRKQNYVHYSDVSTILIQSAFSSLNTTHFATASKSYSNIELAKFIQYLDPRVNIRFKGTDTSMSCYFNNKKTCSNLNLQHEISIFDTIKEMMND